MMTLSFFRLLLFAVLSPAALLCDLRRGKIPNVLTFPALLLSFLLQTAEGGSGGILRFFGGAAPSLLLLPAFCFRMLGAGDIKLLLVLGSMLSFRDSLIYLFLTLLCGAAYALFRMIRHQLFRGRFLYLKTYVKTVLYTGEPVPYRRTGNVPENISFALPAFAGAVLYLGGTLCGVL